MNANYRTTGVGSRLTALTVLIALVAAGEVSAIAATRAVCADTCGETDACTATAQQTMQLCIRACPAPSPAPSGSPFRPSLRSSLPARDSDCVAACVEHKRVAGNACQAEIARCRFNCPDCMTMTQEDLTACENDPQRRGCIEKAVSDFHECLQLPLSTPTPTPTRTRTPTPTATVTPAANSRGR